MVWDRHDSDFGKGLHQHVITSYAVSRFDKVDNGMPLLPLAPHALRLQGLPVRLHPFWTKK